MDMLCIDIETYGIEDGASLQSWKVKEQKSGIICLGWATDNDKGVIINNDDIVFKKEVSELFKKHESYVITGWNLKFDLSFLIGLGFFDILKQFKYLDGMLLYKRIYGIMEKAGLKNVLKSIADIDSNFAAQINTSYASQIVFKTGYYKDVYSDEELLKMYEYCLLDTAYTLLLIKWLLKGEAERTIKLTIIDGTVSLLFADSIFNGIYVNRYEICETLKSLDNDMARIEEAIINKGYIPSDFSSPHKLLKILKNNGINVKDTSLESLLSFHDDSDILSLILEFRKIKSDITKLESILKSVQNDGCLHPEPFFYGTYTGRITYSGNHCVMSNNSKKTIPIGINIQAVDHAHRCFFIAPEGYKLMELDFCGQEMRIFAEVAKEKKMIEFFQKKYDLHAMTASFIFCYDYDYFLKLKKEDQEKYDFMRQIGKVTNLALQYRISANGLLSFFKKAGLSNIGINDAEKARNAYLALYPDVIKYWDLQCEKANKNFYVINKTGRYCILDDTANKWHNEQIAINFPIQSFGAEIKFLMLFCLRKVFFKYKIKFAWDMHDGFYFYLKNDGNYFNAIKEIKREAKLIPYAYIFGFNPSVDFETSIKAGSSWSCLKDVVC